MQNTYERTKKENLCEKSLKNGNPYERKTNLSIKKYFLMDNLTRDE